MDVEYAKNPIREAHIYFQLPPDHSVSIDTVKQIADSLKETFKPAGDLREVQVTLGEQESSFGESQEGLYLVGEGYAIQIYRQGLTFIRHAPYQAWEPFCDQALELWRRVAGFLGKERKLGRIGTRFVNVLSLPNESFDFKKYFRTTPEIAEDLPQSVFKALVNTYTGLDENTVVEYTWGFEGAADKPKIDFYMDIDTFRFLEIGLLSPIIETTLTELRVIKNDIFWKSITEEAREHF